MSSKLYEMLEGKTTYPETWARRGKAEWSHQLVLRIPRDRQLEWAERIIRAHRLHADELGDCLVMHGELREVDDE